MPDGRAFRVHTFSGALLHIPRLGSRVTGRALCGVGYGSVASHDWAQHGPPTCSACERIAEREEHDA